MIAGTLILMHYFDSIPLIILGLFVLASRQHALLVLMHEGVHLRLNRNRAVNNVLSDAFAAFPILADTACYRAHHMKHHQHLNSDLDPDWIRKAKSPDWSFPKSKRQLSWLFLKLCFLAPVEWFQIARYFLTGAYRIVGMKSLLLRAVYFGAIAGFVAVTRTHDIVLYWFGALFFIFPVFQRIRSIAEHFGLPNKHEFNMTRDFHPSSLEGFFIAPHGVHYHLVHHEHAGVPWYNLKAAQAWLMASENSEFRNTAHQNDGFFFGKRSVLKDLRQVYSSSKEKSKAA